MPFAVHISDGVLGLPFWLGGLGITAALMILGSWRISDEEIPRIGLVTAALFVASLIHVRLGPTSVHLMLNGLAGVLLGTRAAVAIPIGVAMQAFLFGHGGFTTIGVTSAIMVAPALLASVFFRAATRLPAWQTRGAHFFLLLASSAVVGLAVAFVVPLVAQLGTEVDDAVAEAVHFAFQPIVIAIVVTGALTGAVIASRWIKSPEFPLGLAIGEATVLVSVALNYLVLVSGSAEGIRRAASVPLALHLPLAVIEGLVLGFTLAFLAKVKPELISQALPLDGGRLGGAEVQHPPP